MKATLNVLRNKSDVKLSFTFAQCERPQRTFTAGVVVLAARARVSSLTAAGDPAVPPHALSPVQTRLTHRVTRHLLVTDRTLIKK